MKPSLFRSGLAPRLLGVALFGLFAFGSVIALDQRSPAPATDKKAFLPARIAAAPTAVPATLSIDSLQPVAQWVVRVDGRALSPRAPTTTSWIAETTLVPNASIVVDAEPEARAAPARNALRIRVAGTTPSRDHTFWCARDWSVTSRVTDLTRTSSPLDPDDLP